MKAHDQYKRALTVHLLAISVLLTCRVSWGQNQRDEIVVIANNQVATQQLSPDEVKAIFLKKRTTWTSGDKIVVFLPPRQSGLRKAFAEHALQMTPEQELRHWQDAKAMTGMNAPKELGTQRHELLRKVFETKGAISYILKKDLVPNVVKVLCIIPVD